jgi:hypothetical protein
MSTRPEAWADTLPDGRWVPTILDTEQHNVRAWEEVWAGGRRRRQITVVEAPRGFDWLMLVVALLSAVAGAAATVLLMTARGWGQSI